MKYRIIEKLEMFIWGPEKRYYTQFRLCFVWISLSTSGRASKDLAILDVEHHKAVLAHGSVIHKVDE